MISQRFRYLILLAILPILAVFFIQLKFNLKKSDDVSLETASAQETKSQEQAGRPKPEKKVEQPVISGDVFNTVGERAGLSYGACYEIYNQVKNVYDLAKLKVGNKFAFYYDEENWVKKIVYPADDDHELIISRTASTTPWQAKLETIIYEIKEKTVEGAIDSSLYQNALAQGADEAAILEFAASLEWTIDFANDPRSGDKYKFIYEERYRDGKYVMSGRVLAGAYLNDGRLYQSFYFEESADNKGYFDEQGNSVQKMFLKAPLAFKYISSPFTTGRRYIEAFNVSTGHRAVDYAAAGGTPIRAVGDGTVTFAGWSRAGYGNLTSVRHNGTYSTNYAHQSKIIVKSGQRVSQGQAIGYVGSTGFSTGAHLHFEMVKNGVKVNPAKEIMPPGKPISATRKTDFLITVEAMKEKIKL